jgi:hypothetical protein
MLAAVSHETYRMFAKRYNIRLTKGIMRKKKTIKELRIQIKQHENMHNVRNGLYVSYHKML